MRTPGSTVRGATTKLRDLDVVWEE